MYKINLCDESSCTQCFACQQVCPKQCIARVEVGSGFFVPKIDREVCIECGACMKACHKIAKNVDQQPSLAAYACWTQSLPDREKSSSGGAFSVMAHHILQNSGVVFGVTMDENLKVKHIYIEDEKDIWKLQGSKYVQSEIGDSFKQVRNFLRDGRKVLFTGTPCQVAALYTFLKRKHDNLYTCDVVCHGVPSQKSFDVYLDKVGYRHNSCKINFRFTKGWGYQMSRISQKTSFGGFRRMIISPSNAYYIRAFTEGLMFGEACYECLYASPKRLSDLTIADYWGLGTMKPFNHPTHKGISLLLVNSSHGEELISSCDLLYREERPMEEAIRGNGNLNGPSSRPDGRSSYYADSIQMNIADLCKKYGIVAASRDYLRIIKQVMNSFR